MGDRFPEQFGELEVTGTVMPGQKSIYAWVETDQKDFLGQIIHWMLSIVQAALQWPLSVTI